MAIAYSKTAGVRTPADCVSIELLYLSALARFCRWRWWGRGQGCGRGWRRRFLDCRSGDRGWRRHRLFSPAAAKALGHANLDDPAEREPIARAEHRVAEAAEQRRIDAEQVIDVQREA